MLPLVKRGQWVSYKIGRIEDTAKAFQSNVRTVWVEKNGRVLKLHKRRHFVKVIEDPRGLGRKEEKPKKALDDLFDDLLSGPTST